MAKENHDPITMLSTASPTPKSSSRLLHQKSLEKAHQKQQQQSPQNLNNASDLFELLERCQSQRLDDQRCVLPSYFLQVSKLVHSFVIV